MRRWTSIGARDRATRQQLFPFRRRRERRTRLFKAAIVAATALMAIALVGGSPYGRYSVRSASDRARWVVQRQFGFEPSREEIEADRHRMRLLGMERTRAALAREVADGGPRVARFLKAARMDPDSAVIRWGNYTQALVLSADVFEPDDSGRSYRLRPNTRSVWLIGLSLQYVSGMFEIAPSAEAIDAGAALGGRLVPQSAQTTNSWGCRGPEPDLDAPLRVLVLGDSIMQGLLVGDDETAPVCLQRRLGEEVGTRVSVLNTGVLGYSLEQYAYTLEAFGDRFRPHCVVVSICGNDFGDWKDPANWEEGKYWLDRISQYCRGRQVEFLVVPYPGEDALLGWRDESVYPGMVSHILKTGGSHYLSPVEDFADEELRLRVEARRAGRPLNTSPLYNRHLLGDNHFSPKGCDRWARSVARRLALLLARAASLGEVPHPAGGLRVVPGGEGQGGPSRSP